MDVIFAGAGEFGVPTLRALLGEHNVVAVYSQPDRPAGRGRKLTPTPVAEFVLKEAASVPLTRTADLNAEALPPADVLVVIAFGQKIADHVTRHPRFGAINLHASRLPKYRGAAPIHRAILGGETVTGNSIIRLAAKMDAGAVLGMSELAIGELETTGELHDRLAADGAPLVLDVLKQLLAGTAVEVEQDHGAATLAKKISREQAVVDFATPAAEIARMVRGLYPWPGCRVEMCEADGKVVKKLTLVRARAVAAAEAGVGPEAGVIGTSGLLATGEGWLEVVEVQPEGSRAMSLAAYRNGQPWPAGARLRGIA